MRNVLPRPPDDFPETHVHRDSRPELSTREVKPELTLILSN